MQVLLNGVISGLCIAVLAIAFQTVYLPTRVFFVGLAGLYTLAPYLYLATQEAVGLWLLSVAVSICGVVVLALLVEAANHAPLNRRGASDGAHLIASLGIYIVVVQVVAMVWGNETRTLRKGLETTAEWAGTILTGSQILMAGLAFTLLLIYLAMLCATDVGLRLRALADNPSQFALYGYNVDAHRLIAFGLAGVFVTAASLLTAYDLSFDPYAGLSAVLLAVVAVIIGGRYLSLGQS